MKVNIAFEKKVKLQWPEKDLVRCDFYSVNATRVLGINCCLPRVI
jgi:hypothetical protein